MAFCSVQTGLLFWKKPCGAESAGACFKCGISACGQHSMPLREGGVACQACIMANPFVIMPLLAAGAGAGSSPSFDDSSEPSSSSSSDSWSGSDSSSSGSDSGGSSDSGSSS